jgi:hypothetical protein
VRLRELQKTMAAALMLPLTAADRIARRTMGGVPMAREAEGFIKPGHRLTSLERLEIYSRSYWFRVLDALRSDFPGLENVLGSSGYERLARAYLADCPSQSYTLRDLGSRLEDWLRKHPQYAGKNHELALDMVRLEWAHIVAFDGPEEKVLSPEDLVELTPALRIGVQPYISLLELHYPVDELRVSVNSAAHEDADAGSTSNVAVRNKHRAVQRRIFTAKPEPIFLAVHRLDLSVYYRRLIREEFCFLQALRSHKSISHSIRVAFRGSAMAAEEVPALLQTWFAAWARFGWLVRPQSRSPKERGNRK